MCANADVHVHVLCSDTRTDTAGSIVHVLSSWDR